MIGRPHGTGWRKCWSVWTGGQSHFWMRGYTRPDGSFVRQWVTWDRLRCQWIRTWEG